MQKLPMVSLLVFCFLFQLVSSNNVCEHCVHRTKATYFKKSAQYSSDACGYGTMASRISNGNLAAGAPSLVKDGAGCGACFQIRCKDSNLCSVDGAKVMLTDVAKDNQTGFVLSSNAFMSLAKKDKVSTIFDKRIVDVEYRRIPCQYNRNMALRVEETSRRPNNLAVQVLYQGGQTEIVGMDVAAVGSSNWIYMSRIHGAVWNTTRAPSGALQFRFVVTSGFDGKWVWAKHVLPQNWTPGTIYSTGLQINDTALSGCYPCDAAKWQ